jgi:signal transduction histidine kinase
MSRPRQRLVSIALQLRAAQAAAPAEAGDLAGRLAGAVAEVAGVLDEPREIANGLHPAVLTEGGLRPALKAVARRSAVPVRLDVPVEGRLPEPAEIAAYYVVAEALGGRLSLHSPPGAGTTLEVHLPVEPARP